MGAAETHNKIVLLFKDALATATTANNTSALQVSVLRTRRNAKLFIQSKSAKALTSVVQMEFAARNVLLTSDVHQTNRFNATMEHARTL